MKAGGETRGHQSRIVLGRESVIITASYLEHGVQPILDVLKRRLDVSGHNACESKHGARCQLSEEDSIGLMTDADVAHTE